MLSCGAPWRVCGKRRVPYVVDSFTVTGRSAGTEAFNEAEQEGTRLEVTPVDPAERVTGAIPLDQFVVSFD